MYCDSERRSVLSACLICIPGTEIQIQIQIGSISIVDCISIIKHKFKYYNSYSNIHIGYTIIIILIMKNQNDKLIK